MGPFFISCALVIVFAPPLSATILVMTQATYEALINSNSVVEFDLTGHILWANQNFLDLVGYTIEEVRGQHHSLFLPESQVIHPQYSQMWADLASGKIKVGEFKHFTKNRDEVWIEGSFAPVFNQQGQVCKIIKMAVDVTEKKSLADRLEKKNQQLREKTAKVRMATYAKSVFLSNISHEIRTPLNSLIGITDSLSETSMNEEQLAYVRILKKANHQLMTMLNDILDLSQVASGELMMENASFELSSLLYELREAFEFQAKEKNIEFKIACAENLSASYVGDMNRLRQALSNILNNAFKFTHQGSVEVYIERNMTARPGNLLFTIKDTGIGIPKSKHREVFRPFTQGDPSVTRQFGGSGLGLAITQQLVHLLGGQIWLQSQVDQGSHFYLTAQMAENDKGVSAGSASALIPSISGNKDKAHLKILIVDDVEDNRYLFGIYLKNTGHQISYASSGVEALEMIEKENFDIIFMDVQMPIMDGYETTRRIRAMEHDKHLTPKHIFACTAHAFAEDVQKSLRAGCDLHLSKPVRKDTLLKTIESILP